MPLETLVETEAEKLEVLRSLRQEIEDLKAQLDRRHNELMGALNEKDEMQRALELLSLEASNYRAVKAIVYAFTERP